MEIVFEYEEDETGRYVRAAFADSFDEHPTQGPWMRSKEGALRGLAHKFVEDPKLMIELLDDESVQDYEEPI